MKKILLYAVMLFTAIGCQVSPLEQDVTLPSDTELVSVTVLAAAPGGSSDSRVSVTPDAENDAWKTAWEEGDVLTLVPVSDDGSAEGAARVGSGASRTPQQIQTLDVMKLGEDGVATFSGENIAQGTYEAYCVKDYISNLSFVIDYTKQTASTTICSGVPIKAVGTLTILADDAGNFSSPLMKFEHLAQVAEITLDFGSLTESYTLLSIELSGFKEVDLVSEFFIPVAEGVTLDAANKSQTLYCYLPEFVVESGASLRVDAIIENGGVEYISSSVIENQGANVLFEAGKHNSIYAECTEIKENNWITFAAETFADGVAYEDGVDNYTIKTAEELALLAKLVNDADAPQNMSGKTFTLANDIDLEGKEWVAIGISRDVSFQGTFDGDVYTISGLSIDQSKSEYSQGLFGYISGATIKNVSVSGSVIGKSSVGGIVGFSTSYSSVTNCYNSATIEGNGNYVGGIVGQSNYTTITNCYNTGAVTNSSRYVGGILGFSNASSSVANCYNTATVTGSSIVGGIVGRSNVPTTSVTNCYNSGAVTGNSIVGGVVGNSLGSVTNCYWANDAADTGAVGGIGATSADAEPSNEGTLSMTLAEMKASIFVVWLNNGAYDYNGKNPAIKACAWYNSNPRVFTPQLNFRAEPAGMPFEGVGSPASPFLIKTAEDMVSLAEQVNTNGYTFESMHIKVANAIDLTSVASTFAAIGTEAKRFKGTFDGGGHPITNLAINSTIDGSYNALFGSVEDATLKNVSVAGTVTVAAMNVNAAGLVAYALNGTIINCSSAVDISATINTDGGRFVGYIGGICASSYYPTVANCYNTGNLEICYSGSASDFVVCIGGVVGYSRGPLVNCYSAAQITIIEGSGREKENVGGVIGQNAANLANTYWDNTLYTGKGIGSGGASASVNAVGKSSDELKALAPTLNDNAVAYNGGQNVTEKACGWVTPASGENGGYPILNWQIE